MSLVSIAYACAHIDFQVSALWAMNYLLLYDIESCYLLQHGIDPNPESNIKPFCGNRLAAGAVADAVSLLLCEPVRL